jgi:predicted ester cyclase
MATDLTSRLRQDIDEIWHKGNLRQIDERCSPDFVDHDVLAGDLDREGFKQFVLAIRNAFPDVRFRLDDVIISNDVATVRWTATGTHRGEFMGVAPTGRGVSVTGLQLLRFIGGQQREMWVNWDVFSLMRQLGLVPQMGAGAGVQPPTEATRPAPEARH